MLVRFSKKQIEAIDRLVAEGVGRPRSEVICRAVKSLDEAICQVRAKLEVDLSTRGQPKLDPEEISAKAVEIALARPERWVWTEDGRCIPEQEAEEQRIPIGQCPPHPSMEQTMANRRVRLKFSKDQLEAIDRLVAEEVGVTRPEAIRRAVERLAHVVGRSRGNEEFAESYRQQPQTELEAWGWTEDGRFVSELFALEQGIPISDCPPPDIAPLLEPQ